MNLENNYVLLEEEKVIFAIFKLIKIKQRNILSFR